MPASPASFLSRVTWALWIALLICVPITSFPLLSGGSGGETPVGPLSLLPLVGLVVLWLVPYLFRGGKLPGTVRPLLGFAMVAVLSAGAASLLPLLPYKGQMPAAREVRALATLAIGLGFYLCTCLFPDTDQRRRDSLRALYAGAAVALAWASVQGWIALTQPDHMPLIITRIHHLISVRDPIVGRVGGLAYEPSWLGNQLMVLYIPLLAAAAFERQSVFPLRRGWLSAESVMLLWALTILALTKSRISQVSFLALASIALVVAGGKALWAVQRRVGLAPPSGWGARRVGLIVLNGLLLIGLVAGLVFGAGFIASQSDARLWALESIRDRVQEIRAFYPNEVAFGVADRLAFAERLVYWSSAFRTFGLYPVLGVGPGNAGFFFEQTLPDYGLHLTEIQEVLRDPAFGFPNPKNLWGRLLAETGLIGFVLFAWWFAAMGLGAAVLWRKGAGLQRYLGLAGLLAFFAQLIEGFSLDTYALPQLWLVFGLATSALWAAKDLSPDVAEPRTVAARVAAEQTTFARIRKVRT